MKRKISLTVIFVIVFTAVIFSRVYSAGEQNDEAAKSDGFYGLAKLSSTPDKHYNFHITSTITPQANKYKKIIEVVQNLTSMAEFNYVKAGWLYCFSDSQTFISSQKTFEDGTPIPLNFKNHNWYLLDDSGKVMQMVGFQDSGDSITSQFTLYQNGILNNITLGTTINEKNYYLKLNDGLIESLINLPLNDIASLEYSNLDGASVVVIDRKYYYPKPTEGKPLESREYIGNGIKQFLDQETGLIVRSDSYYIKVDGTIALASRISNQKCENQPNALSQNFHQPN